MKIATYGCSWTAGMGGVKDQGDDRYKETAYVSWPEELSKLLPNDTIHNYGRGGISNQAIMYFFKKFSHLYDYNIVKLTAGCRYSSIHKSFKMELEQRSPNYHAWNMDNMKRIYIMSPNGFFPHHQGNFWDVKRSYKFWDLWMKHIHHDFEHTQSICIGEYLKSKADFTFGHNKKFKFIDMPTTEENITHYKSHCFDQGEHLDIYGVTKEAKWIKDVIYGS